MSLESDKFHSAAFEVAVEESKLSHFQFLTSFAGIKAFYKDKENEWMRFRLVYRTFVYCKNDEIVDAVLKEFNFDKTEIIKLINTEKYNKENIVGSAMTEMYYSLNRLKKLFELIGQKAFIENALKSDGFNKNYLEYAIANENLDFVQYLFSFDDIQKEYASNKELIWRCVWWMSRDYYRYDESIALYLMKTLNLNEDKLRELQKFKCAKPDNYDADDERYMKYWNESIVDDAINLLLNGKE